jgi:hypothetical protein
MDEFENKKHTMKLPTSCKWVNCAQPFKDPRSYKATTSQSSQTLRLWSHRRTSARVRLDKKMRGREKKKQTNVLLQVTQSKGEAHRKTKSKPAQCYFSRETESGRHHANGNTVGLTTKSKIHADTYVYIHYTINLCKWFVSTLASSPHACVGAVSMCGH